MAVNDTATTDEDTRGRRGTCSTNDTDVDAHDADGARRELDRRDQRHGLSLERRRLLHLHAGRELQRHRQLHLHGHRRHADSTPATVTITVTAVNDAPVAVNDTATTDEDTRGHRPTSLANDTDVDGDRR